MPSCHSGLAEFCRCQARLNWKKIPPHSKIRANQIRSGKNLRTPMSKRKSKGAYMISAVAEMYGIHPQTLRLYEREGLLKPSRTEGNTRLYTDEDMQRQIQEFVQYIQQEVLTRASAAADPSKGAIVPVRRPMVVAAAQTSKKR